MKSRARNILEGAASILNIMPEPRKKSAFSFKPLTEEQIMERAWQMTGDSLAYAMGVVGNEQASKGKRSRKRSA